MKNNKRLVNVIAKKYKKDPDDLILFLWDIGEERFGYLKNQHSVIKDDDLKFIKKIFKDSTNEKQLLKKNVVKTKKKKKFPKRYDFSSIGVVMDSILHINHDEILKIYEALVDDFAKADDPIFPSGVKNKHLLDSALFHPQTAYLGIRKYPTAYSSGAALIYAISNNHPFHNGNKRTALVALLVFLDRHNIFLTCDEDELFRVSVNIASHKLTDTEDVDSDDEIYELANWILEHSKIMRKDEYPITLRKLKKILKSFDCEILENGKVVRTVPVQFLGFKFYKELKSRIPSDSQISDGTELSVKTVKMIRKDLCLDVENGTDSNDFYHSINNFSILSNEFIIKYKNLLTRLSKR